jgi:hypothetical protein
MDYANRLDRVTIFGDKLSFLIPQEWVERPSEEDHYLYSLPEADSGWLRVSLITRRATSEVPLHHLKRLFAGEETVCVEEQTGNSVVAFEKESEERGVALHLYYWKVANVVQPDLFCEAVFSYTMLSERKDDEETKRMVSLVEDLVSRADFLPPADSDSR